MKWLCWIIGHKYRVVQEFKSASSRRIKCNRCRGDWGMCDSVQTIVAWDRDLENMYRSFGEEIKEPWINGGSDGDSE